MLSLWDSQVVQRRLAAPMAAVSGVGGDLGALHARRVDALLVDLALVLEIVDGALDRAGEVRGKLQTSRTCVKTRDVKHR